MPRIDLTSSAQPPEIPQPAPDLAPSLRAIHVDDTPPDNDDGESEDE